MSKLRDTSIDIVGCGTIGRPLALILAGMGAERLTLWDDDVVSPENLGNQGWREGQIGQSKVEALSADLNLTTIGLHKTRVTKDTKLTGDVRFYCVDSVQARKDIAQVLGALLHVDGRIGGEKLQVVCRTSATELEKTIPEANGELPCGQQSTLYIGYVCAGLMVSQFTKWLRGEKPEDTFQHLGQSAGRWMYID